MKRILPLVVLGFVLAISLGVTAQDEAAPTKEPVGKSPVGGEPVENRIKDLHTKLKITSDQEELWKAVTQEMRDSAKSMKDLAGNREQKAKDMSAIDDLKSYSEIASAHAESMKRFVDVFAPLYNAMSDDQKKNADQIFQGHKMAKRKKGNKS